MRAVECAALRLTAGLGLTALLLSLAALAGGFSYTPFIIGALAILGVGRVAISAPRLSPMTVGVAACVLLPCLGAIAPVTDSDALAYVVPSARHIAETGVIRVWTDQARSMWPQSQQVLLAFVLRLGGDKLGVVTALEWLLQELASHPG